MADTASVARLGASGFMGDILAWKEGHRPRRGKPLPGRNGRLGSWVEALEASLPDRSVRVGCELPSHDNHNTADADSQTRESKVQIKPGEAGRGFSPERKGAKKTRSLNHGFHGSHG